MKIKELKQWVEKENIIQKKRREEPKINNKWNITGETETGLIKRTKNGITKIKNAKGKFLINDLSGQIFGRWTVIEFIKIENGNTWWKCQCKCGTIKKVRSSCLKNKTSKSCGCLHKEITSNNNKIELSGKKFGKLLVLKCYGIDKYHEFLWKCKCECGEIKIIRSSDLRCGNVRSCGCLKKELTSKRFRANLVGKKFGRLIVLEDAGNYNGLGQSQWKCKCECGNIKIIAGNSLSCGKTKSCGCLLIENSRAPKLYNRIEKGESGFNRLFCQYKHGAKNRNLEFKLTKEQFKELTRQNCYYCNSKPTQESKAYTKSINKDGEEWGKYVYNGIDRKDNSKGYTIINCVSCCKYCNYFKKNINIKEFLTLIKKIYNHRVK